MVVYGQDKLDEISLSAPTQVCEIQDGWVKSYTITPEAFGFPRCAREDLRGGTPAENAAITRAILQGEQGTGAMPSSSTLGQRSTWGARQTPCRKG